MECKRFLQCCCPPNGQCPCFRKKERYSHIEYYQPSRAIDIAEVPPIPSKGAPIQKIFDFPQETRLFRQHPRPHLHRGIETDSFDSDIMPITQQPTFRETECEPMYVSDKGRTIGTISELPSESPPFTPPPQHLTSHSTSVAHTDPADPAIEFSLYYDIQKRLLSVHLVCVHNLKNTEIWGIADSFMSVFILPSRDKIYQTNISSKTTSSVVFDEVYEFQSLTSEELYEQVLVFQLFSHDKFSRDHLVGSVIVPFLEADLFGVRMVKKIGEGRELLQVKYIYSVPLNI